MPFHFDGGPEPGEVVGEAVGLEPNLQISPFDFQDALKLRAKSSLADLRRSQIDEEMDVILQERMAELNDEMKKLDDGVSKPGRQRKEAEQQRIDPVLMQQLVGQRLG